MLGVQWNITIKAHYSLFRQAGSGTHVNISSGLSRNFNSLGYALVILPFFYSLWGVFAFDFDNIAHWIRLTFNSCDMTLTVWETEVYVFLKNCDHGGGCFSCEINLKSIAISENNKISINYCSLQSCSIR